MSDYNVDESDPRQLQLIAPWMLHYVHQIEVQAEHRGRPQQIEVKVI